MKISKSTLVRTSLLALALTNQVLMMCGKSVLPITDAQVTEIVSGLFTIVTSIWTFWKNNSFTESAIEADEKMKESKTKKKIEKLNKKLNNEKTKECTDEFVSPESLY